MIFYAYNLGNIEFYVNSFQLIYAFFCILMHTLFNKLQQKKHSLIKSIHKFIDFVIKIYCFIINFTILLNKGRIMSDIGEKMTYSVLIAIKDLEMRQNITNYINWKELNFELIASVDDGLKASKIVELLKPDIVITELDLPGVYPFIQTCPIYYTAIFGTGEKQENEINKAFGLGIYKYKQKPIIKEKIYYTLLDFKKELEKKSKVSNNEMDLKTIDIIDYVDNLTVLSAISFIKQNYEKNIGLQEAASVIKVSEAHLSRLFKKETGINYVKYLNSFRINMSINLMYKKELTINQICQLCGFPTPSYFSKIFKKFLGVTPTKYRDSFIFYNKKLQYKP